MKDLVGNLDDKVTTISTAMSRKGFPLCSHCSILCMPENDTGHDIILSSNFRTYILYIISLIHRIIESMSRG